MDVAGEHYRTIWLNGQDPDQVLIIDQRQLPHEFVVVPLACHRDGVRAIADMLVRGAPLIGATAAWSLYLACREAARRGEGASFVRGAAQALRAARPTAVNLAWSIDRVLADIDAASDDDSRITRARAAAERICDEDVDTNRAIGEHGLSLIRDIAARKDGAPVNILTHCNAGWLATVDWGTATAPMYLARQAGVPIHVWVDETRPRNQGAQLTAWELGHAGIPHTVIVDNAGGHLMQHGQVDIVITGTDRTVRSGDVANKIGTYLKALAARDNDVPFYVALPSTTIDWELCDGVRDIPIEERSPDEVSDVQGLADGRVSRVRITPPDSPALNPAFDVTPARLVTGLITERGVCAASEAGLTGLFPERA